MWSGDGEGKSKKKERWDKMREMRGCMGGWWCGVIISQHTLFMLALNSLPLLLDTPLSPHPSMGHRTGSQMGGERLLHARTPFL